MLNDCQLSIKYMSTSKTAQQDLKTEVILRGVLEHVVWQIPIYQTGLADF